MRISEFATKVDETPRTIRFYESIGLLPNPEREPNGYRNYDDFDCGRVRLIRTFQAAGFALNDIARLLAIRDTHSQASDDDLRFLAKKHSEIDARLRTVTDFRAQLANLSPAQSTAKEHLMTTHQCTHQQLHQAR